MAPIHDRMLEMESFEVSKDVGNAKNNSPELLNLSGAN